VNRAAHTTLTLVIVWTTLAVVLCGCAAKGPVYVDQGTSYDKKSALKILAQADSSAVMAEPASRGSKLRHGALASLRGKGAPASRVADLLTRTFPSDTSGVPVYVERASYDDKPAVVVVEATGPDSGTLSGKRLWILDEQGDVLFAGSR